MELRTFFSAASVSLVVALTGCASGTLESNAQLESAIGMVGQQGALLPYTILRDDLDNGAKPGTTFEVRNGGYGSDMVAHPTIANQFYALTDRGPNATYTGEQGKGKLFPSPDYTPRIGLFELLPSGEVSQLKDILLRDIAYCGLTHKWFT